MWTLPTFDPGLAAYPPDPLVGARRRLTGRGALPVFPTYREYFKATCEQVPKQGHLVGVGGRCGDGRRISDGACSMTYLLHRRAPAREITQHCLEFDPLGLNRGHSGSNSLDFYLDFALAPGTIAQHGTISSKCMECETTPAPPTSSIAPPAPSPHQPHH